MQLLSHLRWPWLLSIAGAGLGLAATIAVVWLAGAVAFANYGIDLAKLAVVGLVLELVPSPYAIVRAQRDDQLKSDLATFSIVAGCLTTSLAAVLAAVGWFSGFSGWMLPYVAYMALQRHFDVKLQAEGRLQDYLQLTFGAALLRLALLWGGFQFLPEWNPADTIWAALAVGSLGSLSVWLCRFPGEVFVFLRRDHGDSVARLLRSAQEYPPYYLNASLKRLRDAAMPLLCDLLAVDSVQVARYLLAYRGVDFVCGQLRLVEALLTNLAFRKQLGPTRSSQLGQLAIAGQFVAFASSLLLAGQTGFDRDVFALCFIASFLVYPYVLEIGRRSDAYAEERPRPVTWSLVAHLSALTGTMIALVSFDAAIAPFLVIAPLVGQSSAALSYALVKARA